MKPAASGSRGFAAFFVLFLFFFLCTRKSDSAAMSSDAPSIPHHPGLQSSAPPQQLSAESQAVLRAIVQAGYLAEMRWPNFSDYRKHVLKFYESYGYSLPWVRAMRPTPQAEEVIVLLLKADQKGLSAEDYDGLRWKARPRS